MFDVKVSRSAFLSLFSLQQGFQPWLGIIIASAALIFFAKCEFCLPKILPKNQFLTLAPLSPQLHKFLVAVESRKTLFRVKLFQSSLVHRRDFKLRVFSKGFCGKTFQDGCQSEYFYRPNSRLWHRNVALQLHGVVCRAFVLHRALQELQSVAVHQQVPGPKLLK